MQTGQYDINLAVELKSPSLAIIYEFLESHIQSSGGETICFTLSDLSSFFPFWSDREIRTFISNLKKKKIIQTKIVSNDFGVTTEYSFCHPRFIGGVR